MSYDYLIIGAGLYGATLAHKLKEKGKSVLVIEKRPHVGGNIYTKNVDGINVHLFGAHIFHTSNEEVWEFVNKFAKFNNFINSPIANYKGELYNLPFNMNTFTQIWDDVKTPEDAKQRIEEERKKFYVENPTNLEEQAINLIGETIYLKLIKEYTEKQWGRDCKELPPEIIKRLPVRFTFDNNYFSDKYQGIPIGGYTLFIENMLKGIEVRLNEDYLSNRDYYNSLAKKIIYTGSIDSYYDYSLGHLEYRSLEFIHKRLDKEYHQNVAVTNYTSHEYPFTRIIEHKHFEDTKTNFTVISEEYPKEWKLGLEAYYPVNNERNNNLYQEYRKLASNESKVIFGGRLGLYKYFDMDDAIESALELFKTLD
jgi:UDP-galactopyranose mutase